MEKRTPKIDCTKQSYHFMYNYFFFFDCLQFQESNTARSQKKTKIKLYKYIESS